MERVLVSNHWDKLYEDPKTNKDDGDIPMNDPDMGGKSGGEAISHSSSAMDAASESGGGGEEKEDRTFSASKYAESFGSEDECGSNLSESRQRSERLKDRLYGMI